jgi:sugar transferase (PEP-CTERM/EpsH1 system associated)
MLRTHSRRILMVTPYVPDPPHWGSAIRVRELLRDLSKRHRVSLLTYARPWHALNVREVETLCESVHAVTARWPDHSDRGGRLRSLASREPYAVRRLTTRAMQRALNDLLAAHDFDLVQVESSFLSNLDLSRAPATVLDEHNIEYELLARSTRVERALPRKLFNLLESVKVRRTERQAWKQFDGCVVTSERELAQVASAVPGKLVAMVPNGVNLEEFKPQPTPKAAGLVFTGLMSYRPNVDAVTYFVREVLPLIHRVRPDETFTIVGWGLTGEVRALLGPRVIATSSVPDVKPYLAGAAAVVAPIRMGSGTRLKVLEALAMARPLVSTSLACEGLDLEPGRDLLVADDPMRFAAAVIRVLEDKDLATRLGAAGRKAVESRYGWDACGARLETLHDEVLASKGRRVPGSHLQFPAPAGPETGTRYADSVRP